MKLVLGVFALAACLAAPSTAFVGQKVLTMDRRIHGAQVESPLVVKLHKRSDGSEPSFTQLALASLVSLTILANPLPAMADGQTVKFKLPPIDFNDKNRCVLNSSAMGQANAARDKLYDLRQCKLNGAKAVGFDLSGVLMTDTDVSKADFRDAYFSKGYLHGT
jgi:uncharacterized protein YjbI with pentapeptide repeats